MNAWRGTTMLAVAVMLGAAGIARAHCDRLDGPVVAAARVALEKGDVMPVLAWVKPEQETEVRNAFAKALRVRGQSPEAKEIADRYFFETVVRLHRAGEGAPFEGLKSAEKPLEPTIRQADAALESGALQPLLQSLSEELARGLQRRFEVVRERKKHAGESVEAGRAYVEAYVEFIHYVERIHQQAAGAVPPTGEHKH